MRRGWPHIPREILTLQLEMHYHMKRNLASLPVAVALFAAVAACNSSTYQTVEDTASAAVVKTFSLAEDDSVMAGLDNVFVSIDLIKGLIFNADSLPVGTKVTCLQPEITTLEGASHIELTMKRAGRSDTTIVYTGSAADTVDFSSPVALKVVSPDGVTSRTYTVSVNVHRMEPDSLHWGDDTPAMPMPTDINTPQRQRSARTADRLYTVTGTDGSPAICLAWYEGIGDMGYDYLSDMPLHKEAVTLPFAPRIGTFTAHAEMSNLYMLDTDGALWASSDGRSWNKGIQRWTEIIGAYRTQLLGIARAADGSYTIEMTGGFATPAPAGFPVSGFSMPHTYSFPMSEYPQLLITGGRTADGKLTSHTWGYDGHTWARISKTSIPMALEGMAIAPYYEYVGTAGLTKPQQSALIAFGGRDAAGKLNTVTYVSTDYGFNWRTADDCLQLPAAIPAMQYAQAFVLTTEMRASILPASLRSRISSPIESWPCPYIYLYGGYDAASRPVPSIWRGVINRLSFKPIV